MELPACKPLKIAVVGKGTVLGEEIVIPEHKGVALYTIRCMAQEATIFTLSKSTLYSKFPRFLIEFLKDLYHTRHNLRYQFYEDFLKNLVLHKNFITPVLQHSNASRKKMDLEAVPKLENIQSWAIRKNFDVVGLNNLTPHPKSEKLIEFPVDLKPGSVRASSTKYQSFKENILLPSTAFSPSGHKLRPQTQQAKSSESISTSASVVEKPFQRKNKRKSYSINKSSNSVLKEGAAEQTALEEEKNRRASNQYAPETMSKFSNKNLKNEAKAEGSPRSKKNKYVINLETKFHPKSITNRMNSPDENEADLSFNRIQKNFIISPKHMFQKLLSPSVEGGNSDLRLTSPKTQPTASTFQKASTMSEEEIMSNTKSHNDFAEENLGNEQNILNNMKRMRDLEIGDEKRMLRQDKYLKAKMIKHGIVKAEDFAPKPQGIKSCDDFLKSLNYQKNAPEATENIIAIRGSSSNNLNNNFTSFDFFKDSAADTQNKKNLINAAKVHRQEQFTKNLMQKSQLRRKIHGF